jgi:hypothetical protein
MRSFKVVRGVVTLVGGSVIMVAACGGRVTVDRPGSAAGQGGTGGQGGTDGQGGIGAAVTSVTTTVTTSVVDTVTTTSGTGAGLLAMECTSDAHCGSGLKCLTFKDDDPVLGGGPAGGYCTKPCSSDADCPGAGSSCLFSAGGVGECFLGCTPGEPPIEYLNDPLDPDKCHGREDLRCEKLPPDGAAVCMPTCGSDAHCDGRLCDPRTQVCVDMPNPGKPLGAKCDPDAMVPECGGLCVELPGMELKTMCTNACVLGGEIPNEFECGGAAAGICIYAPQGLGVGDMAYCAQSCGQQDQCQTPDFFCFDIGLPDNGVCLETMPCKTDDDCQSFDAACIETTLGSYCMSESYPLGTLTP